VGYYIDTSLKVEKGIEKRNVSDDENINRLDLALYNLQGQVGELTSKLEKLIFGLATR